MGDTSAADDTGATDTGAADSMRDANDVGDAPGDGNTVGDGEGDGDDADVGSDLVADDTGDDSGDLDGATGDVSTDVTDADDADVSPMTIGERCFPEINDPSVPGPDYDQFGPRVGAHCLGTNHQDITGVERVVFLGDSVTVGTPNAENPDPVLANDHFYRNQLATWLAPRFGLDTGHLFSWGQWKAVDVVEGTGLEQDSGDFSHCAKWGARTDDFLGVAGDDQIGRCFPPSERNKKTLVIFTIGGNDIAAITEDGSPDGGKSLAEVTQDTQEFIQHLEDAVAWLTDPANIPGGVYVVFANPFEFTDGTGDTSTCPVAGLAGLQTWDNPEDLAELVIWANEQYMRIAVDYGVDMIWMLEHFCGHGWVATGPNADTSARCYLGPNTERWFDETCIHPNEAGHDEIADMFQMVIAEPGP